MLIYVTFFAALAISYAAVVPFPNSHCGIQTIKPHVGKYIVGGQEAIPHSWPWMVHLFRFGGHICGGSLISENYVVTAAHCMDENRPPMFYTIGLGSHRRTEDDAGQITVAVASYTLHKSYSSTTFSNDIAMVELAQTITYNDHISPICINDVTPAPGEYVTVTGWGTLSTIAFDWCSYCVAIIEGGVYNNLFGTLLPLFHCDRPDWATGVRCGTFWKCPGGGSLAADLMEVQKPMISAAQCNEWLPGVDEVDDNTMFCAGYEEGGKDSCQGDSGGPVSYYKENRYFLTGIVSWGYGCAGAKKPAVSTKVSTYTDWIKSNSDT